MREQAKKLEVGKWYADMEKNGEPFVNFLRYHSLSDLGLPRFDLQKKDQYGFLPNGFIEFTKTHSYYLPTQEDVLKYNLV